MIDRTTPASRVGSRPLTLVGLVMLCALTTFCGSESPLRPTLAPQTVRLTLAGPTTPVVGTTEAQLGCIFLTGSTHVHPSWRMFGDVAMTPVENNGYEVLFTDVPAGEKLQVSVADPHWCSNGSTGYATSGVSANGVVLKQNWNMGSDQPGFAFTVDARGAITQ